MRSKILLTSFSFDKIEKTFFLRVFRYLNGEAIKFITALELQRASRLLSNPVWLRESCVRHSTPRVTSPRQDAGLAQFCS